MKCLDCCGGDRKEAKNCGIKDCPLYQFRNQDADDGDTTTETD